MRKLKIILKFSFVKFSGKVGIFLFSVEYEPLCCYHGVRGMKYWGVSYKIFVIISFTRNNFFLVLPFFYHICALFIQNKTSKKFVKNYKKPPKWTLVVTSKWTLRINFESEISKKNVYVYCLWNIQYVNLRFITKTVVEHKSELIYPLQLLFKTYSFYF